MADQEVIKHTKAIYKIWNSKQHSFWQKAKEFFIEILIIVFAVSLSIWLHDRSEYRFQQKEAKEFLLGLREDLLSDIHEMKEDQNSFINQGNAFKYITNIKLHQPLDSDTLNKYQSWIFNSTRFQQNTGRFEGFKSSGKIGTLEDRKMQNDIMDLYQEDIPSLLASSDAYSSRKNEFFDFVFKNKKRTSDSTSNLAAILVFDEAQNICATLALPTEILKRYDACIDKMKLIVKEIEDKYNIAEK